MKILVIPDTQIRPGDNLDFLEHIGNYIVEKKPDRVVCMGDFADMPSLSSYDVGKKAFEGRRYTLDIEAAKDGMARLMGPLTRHNQHMRKTRHAQYVPSLTLLLGNHENRINRAINDDAKLEGLLSINDLEFENWGWDVIPFLEVVVLGGVAFSHYFTSGTLGRPCSTANLQLNKKHQSCISGHQQGLQIATGHYADGRRITSVIAGSCYEHNEDYLGPQGNKHWRGILVLHDVFEGEYDLMPVSLGYLRKKYG